MARYSDGYDPTEELLSNPYKRGRKRTSRRREEELAEELYLQECNGEWEFAYPDDFDVSSIKSGPVSGAISISGDDWKGLFDDEGRVRRR